MSASLDGMDNLNGKSSRNWLKNQPQSIVEALWQQCETKSDLCDVTLVVGDTELKAHWCVLVMCPYFESVRSSGMSEATSGRVTLIDTTADAVRSALRHIYLGAVPFDDPAMCRGPVAARFLMQLADYLQLTALKDQCSTYLALSVASSYSIGGFSSAIEQTSASTASVPPLHIISPHGDQASSTCGTALDLYHFAELYDAPQLRSAAYRAIVRDFVAAASQPEMMALEAPALGAFLADSNLRYVPARVMYELLVRWTEHDAPVRAEHFRTMFSSLPLDGIDLDFYDRHIATNAAIQADPDCLRHARQHRRALRSGGSSGGSSGRHHSSSGRGTACSSAGAVAAAGHASSGGNGETAEVIIVGGLRRSRLQYAYVIDENRWTTLPTLLPPDDVLPVVAGGESLAFNRLMAVTQTGQLYLEAVVGQRVFALRQDWQSEGTFVAYELDTEARRWSLRGRVQLPGGSGMQAQSVQRGYWMTAFACGGKLCFLYVHMPHSAHRNALMLAFVDVASMTSAASPSSSSSSLPSGATTSSGAADQETKRPASSARIATAAAACTAAKDCAELYYNESVFIRDFRYCVSGSKLYVVVSGTEVDQLQDVCQLIVYDVERRLIVDQCKEAPFGDVMCLDREGRVCMQSFGKRFCKVYDSTCRQWKSARKSVPALPSSDQGRGDFFTCIHKGCLYVFGGSLESSGDRHPKYCRTPLRYVQATADWEQLAEMPLEFCIDAEAFSVSLPKSMLRCPVDCQHCEQIYREGVPTFDHRNASERYVRRDANQRSRQLTCWSSSGDDSSVSEDYYVDDMSRDDEEDDDVDEENDYDDDAPNDPDCLLM